MSCQQGANRVASAARSSGVTATAGKLVYSAGSTAQVPALSRPRRPSGRKGRRRPEKGAKPPDRRRVTLPFGKKALQSLYIQLSLEAAGLRRQLKSGREGFEGGDPRPRDWAELDVAQYGFLTGQLRSAWLGKGRKGYVDLTGLSKQGLGELWAFANYEAERAQRRIDQLEIPGGPIGSPTSDYLKAKHTLEAQFYSFLSAQIEQLVPKAELFELQVEGNPDEL